MARPRKEPGKAPESGRMRLPPARTEARRIQQLVEQARDLVEERIRDGSASPTEITAVLKLGSEYERANVERIQAQTEYLKAQKAKAEAETIREELFQNAIDAMSRYSGEDQ